MNKNQLIREVARRTGFTIRLSKMVVDCLTQTITDELEQGHKISLKDFGAFCNVKRQGKSYFDIHTNEIRKSVSKNIVKFIPYKGFKQQLCPNVIKLDNDGSLGESIVLEPHVFTPQQPTNKKRDSTPENGKPNIGTRQQRKQELSPSSLVFEGKFPYDKFQGEDDHDTFVSLKVPQKDTAILLPQKDNTGATIGIMEPVLRENLQEICKELKDICILEEVKLPILNRNYSYRPDICLCWEKKNIYIDIEVDEPYDIVSRKPIHYKGNGDNLRDRYFIRNGWCVIRFAEQQVHNNAKGVANYIKRVLGWLTEDENIQFSENSLGSVDRWSYEQAETMASDNKREHYLGLSDYVPTNGIVQQVGGNISDTESSVFVKPTEDILPQLEESKWVPIVTEMRNSPIEYCKVIKNNGYQWVYKCKTLEVISTNEVCQIKGDSPFGYDRSISLNEIAELIPLQNLFSDIHWINYSSASLDEYKKMRSILFDAIANGKPLWIAYDSTNSGYSTRFLSHVAYLWNNNSVVAPHIGLGHCGKHGMLSLSYLLAYCSIRKEFRQFATDYRIKELKVLNCQHVYLFDDAYASSFANLIMSPLEGNNGNAFYENANKILEIMPKNELESLFVQGNLANFQVLKNNIDKAIELYTKNPYNLFLTPTSTWGETCIADIKFFINLFKEHLDDTHDYYEFNAKKQMNNFEEVLRTLSESSWLKR